MADHHQPPAPVHALVDGNPVELIDPFWLFSTARSGGGATEQRQPTCAIGKDPWLRGFVAPMLARAGYRVIEGADGIAADAVLTLDPIPAPNAIRLSDTRSDGAGAIYRYDRDAILAAVEANIALGYMADPRDYGVGIQLLKDLGLRKVRLLTNNPKKTEAFVFGGFDLEVVDQVPIVPPIHEHNAAYLATKREKMGHRLP